MQAEAIKNAIIIKRIDILPLSEVKVIITECVNWRAFEKLPKAVFFDGEIFGLSGWNSDKYIAYYRNDKLVAFSK